MVSFSPVPARSAAPPAVGCGAEPYAGRVAAAEARSAVFNSAVPARSAAPPAAGGGAELYVAWRRWREARCSIPRCPRGARRGRRPAVAPRAVSGRVAAAEARSAVFNSAVPARSAASPAVGGGAEPYMLAAVARSAVFISRFPRGARRRRRPAVAPSSMLAAVARSAVFIFAMPARSAAPPAERGGAEDSLGRVAAEEGRREARCSIPRSPRGARRRRRPAVGWRRALCCMEAEAQSAVFFSAVPARSAAPPAAGAVGAPSPILYWPRSGGGGAKRGVLFRGKFSQLTTHTLTDL